MYAPGVNVRSTYLDGGYLEADGQLEQLDGWARWSGTSFAAPQVAAAIARRVRAGATAREAARQVLDSATWLAGAGPVLLPGRASAG